MLVIHSERFTFFMGSVFLLCPVLFITLAIRGFIKRKSAIYIARAYGRKLDYVGQYFWERGYFASTVGREEEVIREYIWHQEAEGRRIDLAQQK